MKTINKILNKIIKSKNVVDLDSLIKFNYKTAIMGMGEHDKKKVELAFKDRKKFLVFGVMSNGNGDV